MKLNDEEDDATSSFKEHTVSKADAFDQGLCSPGHLEWAAEPFDQSSFDLNFLGGFEVSLAIVLSLVTTFLWVAQVCRVRLIEIMIVLIYLKCLL